MQAPAHQKHTETQETYYLQNTYRTKKTNYYQFITTINLQTRKAKNRIRKNIRKNSAETAENRMQPSTGVYRLQLCSECRLRLSRTQASRTPHSACTAVQDQAWAKLATKQRQIPLKMLLKAGSKNQVEALFPLGDRNLAIRRERIAGHVTDFDLPKYASNGKATETPPSSNSGLF